MSISTAARHVARLLKQTGRKVVFAESCTGGLVSGALTAVPGISDYHCGGVVVYRNETKTAYLNMPKRLLDGVGPVSREVAAAMAQRVLAITPEADVSAAVTGHLGPHAPPALDGLVFVGIASRPKNRKKPIIKTHALHCPANSRAVRQRWVVEQVLDLLASELQAGSQDDDDE